METDRFVSDMDDDDEEGEGAWMASYSDLMTDLLAVFVLLFSFAMTTQGTGKDNVVANASPPVTETVAVSSAVTQPITQDFPFDIDVVEPMDEFDRIYQVIKEKIEQSGYSNSIHLEKSESYIKFRFMDNVLFYPDSPVMRETSYDILKYMGDLLLGVNDDIRSIEIGGHTATTSGGRITSLFAWELSSDRAIAVLNFFSTKCSLPESKMVISGYSHHQPVATNDSEDGRVQNRRVEVKITRVMTDDEEQSAENGD